jgi:imidazolonepropionase-like amidohydrolase
MRVPLSQSNMRKETTTTHEVTVHTSLLFDSKQKQLIPNTSLTINTRTGLITNVFKRDAPIVSTPNTIDLRGLTVLPGFVDAHTHIFLHPYSETPSLNQERDESFVERIVRATNHAKAALEMQTYISGTPSTEVSFPAHGCLLPQNVSRLVEATRSDRRAV